MRATDKPDNSGSDIQPPESSVRHGEHLDELLAIAAARRAKKNGEKADPLLARKVAAEMDAIDVQQPEPQTQGEGEDGTEEFDGMFPAADADTADTALPEPARLPEPASEAVPQALPEPEPEPDHKPPAQLTRYDLLLDQIRNA